MQGVYSSVESCSFNLGKLLVTSFYKMSECAQYSWPNGPFFSGRPVSTRGTARLGPGTARSKRAGPGTRHALGRAWAWRLGTRAGTARPD